MTKLSFYYSPGACSLASHILLHETGEPFTAHRVTLAKGEHLLPDFLAINPRARVPALRIGEEVVTENAAILAWLGDRCGLLPPAGSLDRIRALEWLAWLTSTVHIGFAQVWRGARFSDDTSQHDAIRRSGIATIARHFAEIEARIAGEHALASGYSVVDANLLPFYRWGSRVGFDMRARFPRWTAHTERMLDRPAVQATIAAEEIEMWPAADPFVAALTPVATPPLAIRGYDHVGVRVSERARALRFYGALGFAPEPGEGGVERRAVGLINAAGVRVNLIFNGEPDPHGRNVLMDVPEKRPGWTHPAFTVERLDDVLAWAAGQGVTITEGPVSWGRRRVCFLRDPDGNVLEFDELLPPPGDATSLANPARATANGAAI